MKCFWSILCKPIFLYPPCEKIYTYRMSLRGTADFQKFPAVLVSNSIKYMNTSSLPYSTYSSFLKLRYTLCPHPYSYKNSYIHTKVSLRRCQYALPHCMLLFLSLLHKIFPYIGYFSVIKIFFAARNITLRIYFLKLFMVIIWFFQLFQYNIYYITLSQKFQ